jgi:hypothetical protein
MANILHFIAETKIVKDSYCVSRQPDAPGISCDFRIFLENDRLQRGILATIRGLTQCCDSSGMSFLHGFQVLPDRDPARDRSGPPQQ